MKVKWVHQLDYATSGVLCIALNRQVCAGIHTYIHTVIHSLNSSSAHTSAIICAGFFCILYIHTYLLWLCYPTRPAAALACAAFEQRAVHKEYLAVVEGHILTANTNQHQHHPAWPLLSREDAEREAIDFTEQDHLATAALQASGIKKMKEICYPWQEEVKLRNLEACFSVLHSQALHTYSIWYCYYYGHVYPLHSPL